MEHEYRAFEDAGPSERNDDTAASTLTRLRGAALDAGGNSAAAVTAIQLERFPANTQRSTKQTFSSADFTSLYTRSRLALASCKLATSRLATPPPITAHRLAAIIGVSMAELQGGLQRTAAEGGTLHASGVVARPAEQIAFEPVAGGTSDSGVPPSPHLHHAHTLQQRDASRKCRANPLLRVCASLQAASRRRCSPSPRGRARSTPPLAQRCRADGRLPESCPHSPANTHPYAPVATSAAIDSSEVVNEALVTGRRWSTSAASPCLRTSSPSCMPAACAAWCSRAGGGTRDNRKKGAPRMRGVNRCSCLVDTATRSVPPSAATRWQLQLSSVALFTPRTRREA